MSHDAAPATRPGTLDVRGRSLPLASILGAEAKPAQSLARSGAFLLTGLCFPILAMIAFTILDGPLMWAVGLPLAAGPFIACALSFAWRKPWGVIVETPERYRCVHITADQAEAERLAADIRAAIA